LRRYQGEGGNKKIKKRKKKAFSVRLLHSSAEPGILMLVTLSLMLTDIHEGKDDHFLTSAKNQLQQRAEIQQR